MASTDNFFSWDTFFNSFPLVKSLLQKDDDWFDRQSSRVSVFVCTTMAAVVMFYQFTKDLIVCWCPAHFSDAWVKYANSYCWTNNTYYLPYDREIPKPKDDRMSLHYYQWSAFILLVQAVLYFLPYIVWHGLNSKSGVDSDDILRATQKLSKARNNDEGDAILKNVTNLLHRFFTIRKCGVGEGGALRKSRVKGGIVMLFDLLNGRFDCYMLLLFLFTKLLYIVVAVGQFYLLSAILFPKFLTYGVDVLSGIIYHGDWGVNISGAFPRVTMCDMNVRRLGNVHRYALQCTLPLNRLNEVIYIFLWFWMVYVTIITIFGFLLWIVKSVVPGDEVHFINKHLDRVQDQIKHDVSQRKVDDFVERYLRHDGVFLLRLISHNFGTLITEDIVNSLWVRFDEWEKENLARRGPGEETLLVNSI